jgi:hypothetical protein
MSISVEVSEVIERPVEEVFRIHATEHVQNHPRWDPYMQLEQLTEGPLGVGTMIKRINSHSGVPVKGTMEVVEFELNKSMGMIIKDGPVEIRAFAVYEAKSPDQTILTLKTEFFGLDESVGKSAVTSQMEDAIQNHKRFIESEPRDH